MKVSLKRSRGDMKKKMVRFCDEPTMTVQRADGDGGEEERSDLWYSRSELTAQLEESRRSVSAWTSKGYAVLVANSYLTPHINVQDYLNAFCAGDCAMRGLESALDAPLKEERSQTRQAHVKIVLEAAATSTNNWDAVCQVSRQSSAPSKLFAMRLGRADARWTQHAEAAEELVQEHLRKQAKRRSSKDSVSTASTGALSMDSSAHGSTTSHTAADHKIGPVPALVVGNFLPAQLSN